MTGIDYEIAIPSYRRAHTLRRKTLSLLREYRIPASSITVFVADRAEKAEYESVLDRKSYGKLVVGVPGLLPVINFIGRHYGAGARVVCCDDDIGSFVERDDAASNFSRRLKSLKGLIRRGFRECERVGAHLWGVYPVDNGLFMRRRVTTDLRLIIGHFWGCVLSSPLRLLPTWLPSKDDYLRTILHFQADGAVVRLNWAAPRTRVGAGAGGLNDPSRMRKEAEAVELLVAAYPELVRRARPRGDMAQIRLIKVPARGSEQRRDEPSRPSPRRPARASRREPRVDEKRARTAAVAQ